MESLNISVRDLAGVAALRPVTGGVPIPEGAAPAGGTFLLSDEAGASVPVQTQVLAPWPDGSANDGPDCPFSRCFGWRQAV